MCTLAAYVRVSPQIPLLIAANRDEYLDRPSDEPGVIAHDPRVFAGQDLTAGGTWFGVNEHHMVVGVLNRRHPGGPDPTRRSRGLLCLELLQTRSPDEAADRLSRTAADAYNSFNILVADTQQAFVATNPSERVQIAPLPAGVHLLTNLDLNDPTCPRIAKSSALFRAVELPSAERVASVVAPLHAILSDHTTALDPRTDTIDTLCVHLLGYGTRSSSIVACTGDGRLRFWHASGPPCQTEHRELPLPPGIG
jgi:uncharacterized protein with NRDE domain